jgi:predicted nucleic acid-binding protein
LIVGLDSNILCYAMDPAYPEHKRVSGLLRDVSPDSVVAVNPTVVHEAYHVLVFYLEWFPQEAAERLSMLLRHPHVQFFNQTRKTTQIALNLSVKHGLGGRDALIIANYLANKVPVVYTHDNELLKLKRITWKNSHITFQDPLTKSI